MSAMIVVHGGAGEISDSRATQKECNKYVYNRDYAYIIARNIEINMNKNIQRT